MVTHRRDSALKLYCFCMWPGGEPGQNAKPLYLPPAFLRRLFYAVKISLPSCNPSLTLLLPSALLVKPQYFLRFRSALNLTKKSPRELFDNQTAKAFPSPCRKANKFKAGKGDERNDKNRIAQAR